MHPRFLKYFVITLLMTAVVYYLFSLFLIWIGEIHVRKTIYRQWNSRNILFVSGIQDSYFDYKANLFKHVAPQVVAIGSSRAMQVRGEFFKKSFVNMGGAAITPASLEATVDAVLAIPKKPKLAVVFFDFWWVNPSYVSQRKASHRIAYPNYPDVSTLYQSALVLKERSQKIGLLLPPPADRLGLLGIISNQGFDRFGAHYSVSEVTGERTFDDAKFGFWAQVAKDQTFQLVYTAKPNVSYVDQIVDSVNRLRGAGIHTIVVFPPLSGALNDIIKGIPKKYTYVTEFKSMLKARGFSYYDYTDIRFLQPIAKPDCEFIDGIHAGDVGYARLLLDIARQDSALKSSLNISYMQDLIKHHQGHAMGVTKYMRGKKEVDFLALGCKK